MGGLQTPFAVVATICPDDMVSSVTIDIRITVFQTTRSQDVPEPRQQLGSENGVKTRLGTEPLTMNTHVREASHHWGSTHDVNKSVQTAKGLVGLLRKVGSSLRIKISENSQGNKPFGRFNQACRLSKGVRLGQFVQPLLASGRLHFGTREECS